MTMHWGVRVASALGFACLAAPSMAAPIYSGVSALSFATAGQSMWGPSGPPRLDTGVLTVGPSWDVTTTQRVSQDYRYTIPLIERSTSQADLDVTLGSSGRMGFDFRAILDPGSVDARYSGAAAITVSEAGSTATTRRFTVATGAAAPAAAQIQTRSPQIDIESNFFTRYRATVAASGEAITRPDKQEWGRTGCAIQTPLGCGLPTFGWITTQTEQTANIPDGTATFLNVNDSVQLLKITNQQISVVGLDVATAGQNNQLALNFDIGFDPVEWLAGQPGLDVRVRDDSDPSRPRKSKNLDPSDIVGVSFSMGDVTAYVPLLNTDSGDVDPAAGPIMTAGDTRLAKFDVDGDFFMTTLFGIPFGATVSLGPFSASADLVDADLGTVFLSDQAFSFDPSVEVTLTTDRPARFRLVDASGNPIGPWMEGTSITVPLGALVEIESDGSGELRVTPTYRLRNTFTNRTRLLAGLEYDVAFLQASIDGPASAFIDYPGVAPAKRFTDFLLDPTPLATLFDQAYELGGFNDVLGETIALAARNDLPSTVPEPWSLALFGLGLFGLAAGGVTGRSRKDGAQGSRQ